LYLFVVFGYRQVYFFLFYLINFISRRGAKEQRRKEEERELLLVGFNRLWLLDREFIPWISALTINIDYVGIRIAVIPT